MVFIVHDLESLHLAKRTEENFFVIFPGNPDPPEELVTKLINKAREYPNHAVGSAGLKMGKFPFYFSVTENRQELNTRWWSFDVGPGGELVDVMFNYPGAIYPTSVAPLLDSLDDWEISQKLAEAGVPRKVVKMVPVDAEPNWSYGFRSFHTTTPFKNWQTVTYPAVLVVILLVLLTVAMSTRTR